MVALANADASVVRGALWWMMGSVADASWDAGARARASTWRSASPSLLAARARHRRARARRGHRRGAGRGRRRASRSACTWPARCSPRAPSRRRGSSGFVGLLVPHLVRMAGARTHRAIIARGGARRRGARRARRSRRARRARRPPSCRWARSPRSSACPSSSRGCGGSHDRLRRRGRALSASRTPALDGVSLGGAAGTRSPRSWARTAAARARSCVRWSVACRCRAAPSASTARSSTAIARRALAHARGGGDAARGARVPARRARLRRARPIPASRTVARPHGAADRRRGRRAIAAHRHGCARAIARIDRALRRRVAARAPRARARAGRRRDRARRAHDLPRRRATRCRCSSCSRRLARDGHAVLLVSHQLNLVARFADHIVLLHQGRVAAARHAGRGDAGRRARARLRVAARRHARSRRRRSRARAAPRRPRADHRLSRSHTPSIPTDALTSRRSRCRRARSLRHSLTAQEHARDTARTAPVVVTATRSPLASERAPSSVTVLTGDAAATRRGSRPSPTRCGEVPGAVARADRIVRRRRRRSSCAAARASSPRCSSTACR